MSPFCEQEILIEVWRRTATSVDHKIKDLKLIMLLIPNMSVQYILNQCEHDHFCNKEKILFVFLYAKSE